LSDPHGNKFQNRTLRAELRAAVAPFESPDLISGIGQIASSLGLYLATMGLMYWSLAISPVLSLALAVPAAALLVRVFIVQHDCGHGSFMASRRGNDILGRICATLTLVPYAFWRKHHNAHHANWNNLDRQGSVADVYTVCLSVEEYRALGRWDRFLYRFPRHPLIAFFVIPPLVFLILYRTPFDTPKNWSRERRSAWATNLAIALFWGAQIWAFGFAAFATVQLSIVLLASIVGFWLFSVQHRFENARWMRREEWTHMDAALSGSSHLALPRILHWLTGNIGFHHIHHLSPRVPNYRLADCHASSALLRPPEPLTLGRALAGSNLVLWDEVRQRMIRFADLPAA
jgi:omega-6 fatty acid desaturase (delta-12 desaturase)